MSLWRELVLEQKALCSSFATWSSPMKAKVLVRNIIVNQVCVLYKIKPLERVFLPTFRHQGVVTVKALVSDHFEIHKSGRN